MAEKPDEGLHGAAETEARAAARLDFSLIPEAIRMMRLRDARRAFERGYLIEALTRNAGERRRTAEEIGITVVRLRQMMAEHGIRVEVERRCRVVAG